VSDDPHLALQLAIAGVSVGSIYAPLRWASHSVQVVGVLNFGRARSSTFGAYAALILTQLRASLSVVVASRPVARRRGRRRDRAAC